MKVNSNDPVTTYEVQDSSSGVIVGMRSNMPIRLEIAARLLAGVAGRVPIKPDDYEHCLNDADKLIAAHNETSG